MAKEFEKIDETIDEIVGVEDANGFEGPEVDEDVDTEDIDSVDDEDAPEGPEVDEEVDTEDIGSVDDTHAEEVVDEHDEEDEYIDVDELLEQDKAIEKAQKKLDRAMEKYLKEIAAKLETETDPDKRAFLNAELDPTHRNLEDESGNVYKVLGRIKPKHLFIASTDDAEKALCIDVAILRRGKYRDESGETYVYTDKTSAFDADDLDPVDPEV